MLRQIEDILREQKIPLDQTIEGMTARDFLEAVVYDAVAQIEAAIEEGES